MPRRLEPVRGSEDTVREAQPPGRAGEGTTPTNEWPERDEREERNERNQRDTRESREAKETGETREPKEIRNTGNTVNTSDSCRATQGGDEVAPASPAPDTPRPQPSCGAGGAERRPASASASPSTDAARERLALAQTALLSALVAGTPAPEGFDRGRLRVQSRVLTAKRAAVVAKVAPELPEILGDAYRPAFLGYARYRPLRGGYRQDALDFAAYLLAQGRPEDPAARQQLTRWWRDRAGPRPPSARPMARLARAVRRALHRQ